MAKLKDLRKKIDDIDLRIVKLLNSRAKVVLDIKETKKDDRLKVYYPAREREILKRLEKVNPGPFPSDALIALYKEILSTSRSLQGDARCLHPLWRCAIVAGRPRRSICSLWSWRRN